MKMLILFILVTTTISGFGQDSATIPPSPKERPIIGLCLSGGGAKGFAHIGVLKIIDSLGIPIDYITGTSMGSIIGGLYAIGYTPQQIEELVVSADWADLLNPKPKRQYESFSTKDFSKRNLLTLGLKNWKVKLPSGLNNANKLYQKLNKVTIGYHGYHDFLQFPRGFSCVAADLNTGHGIVISNGSLPDAMRASMSIPSIFTPHKYNGQTFVDGGSVNNFPTDELKKLGCEIIIGIDLHAVSRDSSDMDLAHVLEKTSMFSNFQTSDERIALCDVFIHPNMDGFATSDFDRGAELIIAGEEAGRLHTQDLLALLAKTSNKNITPVSAYQQIDSVRISRLDIQGLKRVSTNYVSGTFDIEPGQAVAVQELEEAISMLYGSSYFSYATYNLIEDPEKPGSYVAVVRLTESPYDLDIGVSLHHDPDFKTGILLNFYTRNFLAKGSRLNFDAAFSEHPRFRLLYEVDRGHKPGFGISSDLYFIKPTLYNDRGNSEGTYNYTSSTTALYALVTNKNHRILKLGGEYTGAVLDFKNVPALRNILDPEENNPTATKLNFNLINIFTELDYDSRDDFDFPRKGHKVYLGARYHTEFDGYLEELFQKNYVTARLRYAGALSPTSWLTFLPQLDAGVSMLDYSEFPFAFNIGGLGRNYFGYQLTMPGYHYMQVAGASNYAGTQLEVRFSPFKNHYASVLGGWGAFTSAVGPIDLQNLQYGQLAGIGVKYGLDTFIGPIEITAHKDLVYGYGWLAYFNFGYWF